MYDIAQHFITFLSGWFAANSYELSFAFGTLAVGLLADIQGVLKEYIEPELAETFEREGGLLGKFKKGKAVPVSDRASRMETEIASGGVSGGVDWNGGSIPTGDNNLIAEFLISTIGLGFSRTITDKMIWATDSKTKAIVDAWSRLVTGAMREWGTRLDMQLQGNGTGVRAIIKDTSTDTPPQYSVAIAGNPQACRWLREGEKYDIYDSTLATLRAGGPYQISKNGGILHMTQDVTFTASITGAAASDRIVGQGLKDADLNGLAYHISDSASGTYQNVARTAPWVQCRSVDAGSSKLDWSLIRLSLNLVRERLGGTTSDVIKGLTPYCGPEQQQNYEDAAQAISQVVRSSNNGTDKVDMMMGDGKVQGKDVMINIHADPTIFDWIEFDAFRRLEMTSMDFYKDPFTGSYVQPLYGTAASGITGRIAMYQISLKYQVQLAATRVVGMSYVKSLSAPSGYPIAGGLS